MIFLTERKLPGMRRKFYQKIFLIISSNKKENLKKIHSQPRMGLADGFSFSQETFRFEEPASQWREFFQKPGIYICKRVLLFKLRHIDEEDNNKMLYCSKSNSSHKLS